jgi:hypothetical protein
MTEDQPTAPNQRSFSLNSQEFYEAVRPAGERPWIPNGSLPREPRWPREPEPVAVWADNEADAGDAFQEWRRHLENGRIGGGR